MQQLVISTKDGSSTVHVPHMNATYHSYHGALRESEHVFLQTGMHFTRKRFPGEPFLLFEMGFGTGLNALLTALEAEQEEQPVHYTTLELHPLSDAVTSSLNYGEVTGGERLFRQLHAAPWNEAVALSPKFTLEKREGSLQHFRTDQRFHLIYYDAFAPSAQPELWTEPVFRQMYELLRPGGILVTYCSKSVVRRAMMAAGFVVTKPPGPFGKREIVRAERKKDPE